MELISKNGFQLLVDITNNLPQDDALSAYGQLLVDQYVWDTGWIAAMWVLFQVIVDLGTKNRPG